MKHLIAIAIIVGAAGCYSPDLPDCAVTCATDDDCAGDQVCNEQNRCAAAGQTCNADTIDAGPGETMDGSMQRMVTLKVMIMGKGKVSVTNVGECEVAMGPAPMCEWMVPAGRYQITATKTDKDFDKWASILCANQGPTCNTDILLGGTVIAKFK